MARQYYYYKALRKTIIQFLDIFNDVEIARYDSQGNFEKFVEVPVKFALKEKVWYWMNERKDDEMLPMISVAMNGVELAKDRIPNRYDQVTMTASAGSTTASFVPNPMPYDVNFIVSVWALYMTDIDQIIEQILSFFAPDIFMRIRIDEVDFNFDVKVLFNSASPEMDLEMPDEMYRVVRYSLDFTAQTFFFRPVDGLGDSSRLIEHIYVNFYTNDESWDRRDSDDTFSQAVTGTTEAMHISAGGLNAENNPIWKYELYHRGELVGDSLVYGDE